MDDVPVAMAAEGVLVDGGRRLWLAGGFIGPGFGFGRFDLDGFGIRLDRLRVGLDRLDGLRVRLWIHRIGLDDLQVLGPIFVLKLAFNPEALRRRMVAELWLYPDGSRILELSTKCAPSEAFQVAAEAGAFLTRHGIDMGGEQQTKTATALEFFSQELAGPAKGPAK